MALLRQTLAECRIAHGEWTLLEANLLDLLSEPHCDESSLTESSEDPPPFEDERTLVWS